MKTKKTKALRWVALGAALPALWACNSHPLQAPNPQPMRTFNNVFQETVNRDIDILFMIDNSLSMAPLQTKLATNFPIFMQVLNGLPNGLPNVHIGVVSSNMGSGSFEVPQCPLGGDQGIFQATPRGTCTATNLMGGATFISNVNGMANYTGSIESVFSCIAQLGDQGCGFEAPFGSVVRALGADGFAPPPENANFLRPNAFLSIILITNEDDCSVPDNSNLFDPGSRLVSDQFGPLASFRCNEYGHVCDGGAPSRTTAGPYTNCVSAEFPAIPVDQTRLKTVAETVMQIKSLKTDPNKILVAAIAGLPTPYSVDLVAPMVRDDPAMWPAIHHSCTQDTPTGQEYADPGVRLASFIQAFGRNGVYQTICAASFAPALQRIAEEIGKQLGPKCIEGALVQKNGRPDCTVIDHTFTQEGNPVDTAVPACADNNNTAPCWQLIDGNAMACTGQKVLSVMRDPNLPPQSDLNSSVSCSICIPGVVGPDMMPLPGCP